MTSIQDHLSKQDYLGMCKRLMRWEMAKWSGIRPFELAWDHFRDTQNFTVAFHHPDFKRWYSLPQRMRLEGLEPVPIRWPVPLSECKREFSFRDFADVVREVHRLVGMHKNVGDALSICRRRAEICITQWANFCKIKREVLESLEAQGPCIADLNTICMLIKAFKLPAKWFCFSEKLAAEADWAAKYQGMSIRNLQKHLNAATSQGEWLRMLRVSHQFSENETSRGLSITMARYQKLENNKAPLTPKLIAALENLYGASVTQFCIRKLQGDWHIANI